jgi:hypothetical protein
VPCDFFLFFFLVDGGNDVDQASNAANAAAHTYIVSTVRKFMKHPSPSDFTVEAKEAHVSVIFKPSDSHYNFGRLADPEDIARYGPLSRSSNVRHRKTGDTGEYPENEVAQMAHTLAVKAITTA